MRNWDKDKRLFDLFLSKFKKKKKEDWRVFTGFEEYFPDPPLTVKDLTTLEKIIEELLAKPQPERIYNEIWTRCQRWEDHDFTKFKPSEALRLDGIAECQKCGMYIGYLVNVGFARV
jgi:hypothetical protein